MFSSYTIFKYTVLQYFHIPLHLFCYLLYLRLSSFVNNCICNMNFELH